MAKSTKNTDKIKTIKEDIINVDYSDEMRTSYLDYSMSVITDRAIPDVRDGLKPVHRRILYGMKELGLKHNLPYKKSARIVGEVMGKYHPHGDCLDESTRVFMLDGTIKTIKELYEIGKPQWVLSLDEQQNKIIPAIAEDFRIGQYATKLFTIEFINGYKITVTNNHPFRLTNGQWIKAEEIKSGMILDYALIEEENGYLTIASPLNTDSRAKELLHNIVANETGILKKDVVHHIDRNPHNNTPENLTGMSKAEHAFEHKDYEKGLELGRKSMFGENGKYVEITKKKNSELAKAINKHRPIIIARHAMNTLRERNIALTEENYESLRGEIYNLTKIRTLIDKKYIDSFDDFVEKIINGYEFWDIDISFKENAESAERKRAEWKPNIMTLVPVVGTAERSDYNSKLSRNEIKRTDGKVAAIAKYFNDEEYYDFVSSHLPIVKEVIVTEIGEPIPMYDFTVNGYHNMLLCASENIKTLVVAHNSSIYDAMAHMAQDWCYIYPLVDGHGNFGSIEGDEQAASRYTEAKLSKIAEELYLQDLEKGVVEFVPNFDDNEKEPVILPVKIPNLLISGTEGIAVGMASKMPTHNLGEVVDGVIAVLDNPKITTKELLKYIKGPDFATGGIIANAKDLISIYETGAGKIRVRGKVTTETLSNGRVNIVITEIPYTMIGAIDKFMDAVAALVHTRATQDITDIKNFSGKEGIRIVIETKKGANIDRVINMLYKKAKLEDVFGYNAMAISNGLPKQFSLIEIIKEFNEFNSINYTKRYQYLLEKENIAREVKEGLVRAIDCVDLIIEILRGSKKVADAKECLMHGKTDNITFKTKTTEKQASKLNFTERQTDAILEMKMQRLIGLEILTLQKELAQHIKNINEYSALLNSKVKMKNRIKNDLLEIKAKYALPRKTKLLNEDEVVIEKDEIVEEDMYVVIDKFGYTKAFDKATYERNIDMISSFKHCVEMKNTDKLCIFTDTGKCHFVKGTEIPFGKFKDKGSMLDSISNYASSENILLLAPFSAIEKSKMFFGDANGMVKIVEGSEFVATKRTVDSTKKSDVKLVAVNIINKETDVSMKTNNGMYIRFKLSEVSEMKKASVGVRGIKLKDGDTVTDIVIGVGKDTIGDVVFTSIKLTKCDGVGTKKSLTS